MIYPTQIAPRVLEVLQVSEENDAPLDADIIKSTENSQVNSYNEDIAAKTIMAGRVEIGPFAGLKAGSPEVEHAQTNGYFDRSSGSESPDKLSDSHADMDITYQDSDSEDEAPLVIDTQSFENSENRPLTSDHEPIPMNYMMPQNTPLIVKPSPLENLVTSLKMLHSENRAENTSSTNTLHNIPMGNNPGVNGNPLPYQEDLSKTRLNMYTDASPERPSTLSYQQDTSPDSMNVSGGSAGSAGSSDKNSEVAKLENRAWECDSAHSSNSLPDSGVNSPMMQCPSTPSSLYGSESRPLTPSQKQCLINIRKGCKITPILTDAGESKYQCPICPEQMDTIHSLTTHIRSHNTTFSAQNNCCTICGKILSSQSSLDRHMLVHSGERPFHCKYCDMTFTTNGNMHRHSRIHRKENPATSTSGALNGEPMLKTPYGPGAPTKPRSRTITPKPPHSILQSLLPLPPSFLKERYEQMNQMSGFGYGIPNIDEGLQALKRRLDSYAMEDGMIPMKRKFFMPSSMTRSPPKPVPERVPSVEEDEGVETKPIPEVQQEGDILHCPLCPKTFLCKYGLQCHLETHPEVSCRCQECNLTFRSQRGLAMHKLMVHSKSRYPTSTAGSTDSSDERPPAGFHDLNFMDFSIDKFSLVAKAWCEKNVRRSSSIFHDFTCKVCDRAFPCQRALSLHELSHIPEHVTICPLCDCNFEANSQLRIHMVKHMSDQALEETTQGTDENANEAKKSAQVGQHDFLAMFDLHANNDLSDNGENFEKIDRRLNDEYFAKLGQVFSKDVKPQFPPKPIEDNKPEGRDAEDDEKSNHSTDEYDRPTSPVNDLSDIQQIIRTASSNATFPSLADPNFRSAYPQMFTPQLVRPTPVQPGQHPIMAAAMGQQPNIHAAFLPSLNAMNMMHAVSMGLHNGEKPGSPPPSDDGSSVTDSPLKSSVMSQQGVFSCKYCDMVFNNYRALKGHIRIHLGLSPYQCNLCPYSSADKSTLIRHLRTHNGQRPYQCLICEFAFTTKANCERHVRKKHLLTDHEEIEKSIRENEFAMEESPNFENFHSPDTVCKFCGEDFKFFRALKHHVRTHSACRQKPFCCQQCGLSFATKANCIRHLQKQHPEVPPNLIEQFIHINEPAMLMMQDESDNEGSPQDDVTASPVSRRLFNDVGYSASPLAHQFPESAFPSPFANLVLRPAHSTPITSASRQFNTWSGGFDDDDNSRPVPSHMPQFKQEPEDDDEEEEDMDDQPIDFSVKQEAREFLVPKRRMVSKDFSKVLSVDTGFKEEQPIDLSVKTEPGLIRKFVEAPVSNASSYFQCQYCPMGFHERQLLGRHQQIWHYEKNNNNRNSGPDAGSDLASVTKMLDAANPMRFQSFFRTADVMRYNLMHHFRQNTDEDESGEYDYMKEERENGDDVDENMNIPYKQSMMSDDQIKMNDEDSMILNSMNLSGSYDLSQKAPESGCETPQPKKKKVPTATLR